MARRRLAAVIVSCVLLSGCAWLSRGSDDQKPEKLYTDKPCSTECCCKTKKGFYVYFRCLDREPCEKGGGACARPDIARCSE